MIGSVLIVLRCSYYPQKWQSSTVGAASSSSSSSSTLTKTIRRILLFLPPSVVPQHPQENDIVALVLLQPTNNFVGTIHNTCWRMTLLVVQRRLQIRPRPEKRAVDHRRNGTALLFVRPWMLLLWITETGGLEATTIGKARNKRVLSDGLF